MHSKVMIHPNRRWIYGYENGFECIFLFLLPGPKPETSGSELFEISKTQALPIQNTETGEQDGVYIKLQECYLEKGDNLKPVLH